MPEKEDWYDKLVEVGRKRADDADDEFAKEGAKVALKILEDNKDDLIVLGKDALVSLIFQTASGRISAATKFYIANCSDPDALIAGVASSGSRIVEADALARENAERAVNVVRRIAGEAARFLLPVILGAV